MPLVSDRFSNKKLAYNSGFTLLELMITISIAGILAAIAIPSFKSSISGNRLTTNTNELVTALNLARSEAVKRGQQVVVRRSGTNWENGWTVFVDIDRTTTAKENVFDTLDTPLRTSAGLQNGITLRASSNYVDYVRYTPSGQSNLDGRFVVCDSGELSGAKLIIINPVGRVQIGSDTDNDNIPENAGTEITSCTSGF